MKCRLVDADGPLARLKKAIFNPELYENIAEWIVVCIERIQHFTVPIFSSFLSLKVLPLFLIHPLGSLVGCVVDGHRPYHAHGWFH